MLMCWNEQPLKRPTFTELRARFDSMLLADKKGDYIDLRIDQSKLYYQLVASTKVEGESHLDLKKQSSDSTLKSHGSQNEMECTRSKSPAATLDAMPGLKSSCASCIDQASQARPQFLMLQRGTTAAGGGRVAAVGGSSGMLGPGGPSLGRDRTYENAGRPVSMYLSGDRDRRERQDNPYVDEPSRMAAATSLTPLSNGDLNGHAAGHWRSDGDIEMSQMEGYVEMNGRVKGQATPKPREQNGPEIKICFSED